MWNSNWSSIFIYKVFFGEERGMVLERGGGEIHVYFRPRNANVTGFKSIRCERSDLIIPRSRHLLHYNSADRAPLCVHKAVQLSGNYYSIYHFNDAVVPSCALFTASWFSSTRINYAYECKQFFFFACKLILFFFPSFSINF